MEDSFNFKVAALEAASALIGFAEMGGELSTAGLLDRIGKKRAIATGLLVNGVVGLLLPRRPSIYGSAWLACFFFISPLSSPSSAVLSC